LGWAFNLQDFRRRVLERMRPCYNFRREGEKGGIRSRGGETLGRGMEGGQTLWICDSRSKGGGEAGEEGCWMGVDEGGGWFY